jgi:hypothetical protein
MRAVLLSVVIVTAASAAAHPCTFVQRGALIQRPDIEVERHVAKLLGVADIDVLESLRVRDWHVLYVNTHESDELFVFLRGDPRAASVAATWGGAAARFERKELAVWARRNARGVPRRLARCFAWYAVEGRHR